MIIGICSACSSPENYYSALVSVLLKVKKIFFFFKCCIKKGDYVSEDIDIHRCEATSVEN